MKEIIRKLKPVLSDLHVLHEGAASLEHAIKSYNGWESYKPTRFIYAFFSFNTLYSINWPMTLKQGRLYYFNHDYKEWEQYTHFIDFCFRDKEFVEIYEEFFFNYVTTNNTVNKIKSELEGIKIDERYTGNIFDQEFIDSFYEACVDCLERRNFNKSNCLTIVKFIYKIRCNIFHGAKTLKELHDKSQQRRILIYTDILIAINQMLFSYLLYLAEGERALADSFSDLYDNLSIENND